MELALGHFLQLSSRTSGTSYQFQNFYIGQAVDGRSYVPFGFSGVTTSRQGDNLDAVLVFPNNELSRGWASQAVEEGWTAHVVTYLLDPDDTGSRRQLYEYWGQISAATWDDTSLNLKLNTVLNAVDGNAPVRLMHRSLVGRLPTTSGFGL
jgi:hypothetical protein